MEIKHIDIALLEGNNGQVNGLPANPRKWTQREVERIAASLQETPELLEARPLVVVPNGSKYVVLGGNLRLAGIKHNQGTTAPCAVMPDDTSAAKLKEIVIKDNSSFGEWDFDLLTTEWDDMPLDDWGVKLSIGEDEVLPDDDGTEVVEDEVPTEAEARVQYGDVWMLGKHVLMCGDSTKAEDVARLMDGEQADLVFADPPYGMKKESEGIFNDNLNFDDLLEFNKQWIPLSFNALKDNGSWYCWGIDEPLMDIYGTIIRPLKKNNRITFRNLITWDKGNGQGQKSKYVRKYATVDEKCLFVMKGQQEYGRDLSTWYEGFEPFRVMWLDLVKAAGLTIEQATRIAGSTYASHFGSKSQYAFFTEEAWSKILEYCARNNIPVSTKQQYEEIKQQYEEIKQQWQSTRAYFDNTHDNMKNVWHFARTSQAERDGLNHATPKPLALCARVIKTSSREEEIVLDTFGGSGSTVLACEQLNRKARVMEIDPHYCDIIIKRWEVATGGLAIKK